MRVDATSQAGAQLAFDVARPTAFVSSAGLGQKRLEVSRDQPVKRSRLRWALFIASEKSLGNGLLMAICLAFRAWSDTTHSLRLLTTRRYERGISRAATWIALPGAPLSHA